MVLIPHSLILQDDPPRSPKETLPTMYDLPSEDPEEPGLPDEFHDLQPQLLSRTLRLTDYARGEYFTASDLNLYYDVKHPLWHKRPDWFLVVNVPRLYEGHDLRRSYVIWQEGRSPEVVVEFLSPGTESEDLGRFHPEKPPSVSTQALRSKPPEKLEVYEEYLRVPHYIVYSRYTQRLFYFKLVGGCYVEQAIQSQNPRLWLDDLGIGLGIWEGAFDEVFSHWLRWCDRDGNWLQTDTEQAQLEMGQMQAQLYQAARNLLETGMEITQVAEILGLSEWQIQNFMQNEN